MVGGGGFPRSFETCIYIWKETGTELGTPLPGPLLLPAGEACTFPRPAPAGEEAVVAEADLGKGLGRGKKEIFIFEPLCLFCLRLKDGKTKRVCLLLVFLCPLPLLGKRSQGLLASFHLALPYSWGSGKGKPRFPIHKTGRRMGQEEGRSLPSSGLGLRKLESSEPRWDPPVQPQDLVSPAWTPS